MPLNELKLALALAMLVLLVSCERGERTPSAGNIVSVDTLGARYGLSVFRPVRAAPGPDGALYLLDHGNSELYRLKRDGGVDTLARKGAGPGQLDSPVAFTWLGDSALVVLDGGNKRVQFFDRSGRPTRTFPYTRGATSAAFDPARGRLYAATFGRGFSMVANRPQVDPDSLASVISLKDGEILGRFATPRPYEQGGMVSIAANYVHIGRNPANGELWVVWPVEPVVARYSADGRFIGQFERPLSFTPPVPKEVQSSTSPFPRADFQQITFDAVVDSANLLYVLTPLAAKEGLVGSEEYQPPPQAVDVLDSAGKLRCRLELPFIASSLALDGPGSLILTDAIDAGEVYRVRYRCPGK
jgi:hypothetical protein